MYKVISLLIQLFKKMYQLDDHLIIVKVQDLESVLDKYFLITNRLPYCFSFKIPAFATLRYFYYWPSDFCIIFSKFRIII